jgi:hypothetical protein
VLSLHVLASVHGSHPLCSSHTTSGEKTATTREVGLRR